jgi:predicted glycoside hydrolase/deacetylase ChbG (UPF0249 family)
LRRIIINADDFGLGPGVNRGVLAAHEAGALRSTTLLASGAAFGEAAAMAKAHPELGVGCHLALTGMPALCPPAEIPSLVGPDGGLWPTLGAFLGRWTGGRIRRMDVQRELAAQIERVLAAGIRPTHVDGHKHVLALPGVLDIVLELCRRYHIPAMRAPFNGDPLTLGLAPRGRRASLLRQWLAGQVLTLWRRPWRARLRRAGLRAPDSFRGLAFTGLWTREYLEEVAATLPEGITELMTHPAVLDENLQRSASRLKESRQRELEFLTGVLPGLLLEHAVESCSYAIFGEKDA